MPRRSRVHYAGAVYHVILRGNDRGDIFFDDLDRFRFFLLLQEGMERFNNRILAFCLMTNHVHLAIQVDEVPLSRIIQNLSFRYTRWINWRKHRVGHLFQGRYRAFLVDQDSYLLELVAYIHLNPLRAGITKTPEAYRWSSHLAFLGKDRIPWLDPGGLLALFSSDLHRARLLFRDFVEEKARNGHSEDFYGKKSLDPRFVAPDQFVDAVLKQQACRPEYRPHLDVIIDCVKAMYNLTEAELASSSQKRVISEARMLAAWAVREVSCSTLADLARAFCREASAISAAAERFDELKKTNQQIAQKVEELKMRLSVFQA